MAWIESHQSLGRHPKMLRLATRVRVCRPQVIGHLQYLWWWTLDYAPDGNLSPFSAQELAAASEWNGDPDLWLAALKETGWINEDGHLHDWQDYAGKLVQERTQAKERMRTFRERQRELRARSTNVRVTCDKHSEVANPAPPGQGPEHPIAGSGAYVHPPWPTLDECRIVADLRGIPGRVAEQWWLEHDARGGLDKRGQPLGRWQSSLLAFAATWRANEEKDAQRYSSAPRNGRAAPEPQQIRELVRAKIIPIG